MPDNRFEKFFSTNKKKLGKFKTFFAIIGIIFIIIILLELFSFAYVLWFRAYSTDSRLKSEIYEGQDWAGQLFYEFTNSKHAQYSPYVGFKRVSDFSGQYITLDENSLRYTENYCSGEESMNIFIFGGSAVWGTGARNNGTIPSYISRYLCDAGFNVNITNFGESGYTSNQEIIRFQMELLKGNVPDIVVFYDGYNDFYSTFQNKQAGLPQNIHNRQVEFNSKNTFEATDVMPYFNKLLISVMAKYTNRPIEPLSRELVDETASVYRNNVMLVRSLEDDYRFKSLFYWQPCLYTKKQLSDAENSMVSSARRKLFADYKTVASKVREPSYVVDMTGVFDHDEQTIYIDGAHVSEEGNSIVAQRIAEDLMQYLK